ncbi:twin-arginine translocase TatA/TatE family subunit [Fluoribacter dumoffii]|uniref:Sec-independent protein translocase protein TatA n=1 Tax=Fluoribacter dumoffii TaxID=463 RepID=A0A377G5X0_9GAMM|nr:twin-arginine translocase TatA/TatE family subunit [Fluoribacter dumoffii]KTC91573.1 TatA protein(twin arginine translocation) [Fluoribacter dumoffii NY 23]STO20039.1 Sec-independent protein translocase protein TatA [Fluoribacter dumoffii]
MGLSGISPLSLLLILVIIIALFGTSKLKTIGTDLGEAIRNFRKALNEDQTNEPPEENNKSS